MDIGLRRKIEVNSYEAIMKIGIRNDRLNIFIPILELSHKSGFLNHRDINGLFVKNPENAMGKNILQRLENYGFVNRQFKGEDMYNPTDKGKEIFKNLKLGNFTAIDPQIMQALKSLEFINSFYGIFSAGYNLTEQFKTFMESHWPIKSSLSTKRVCDELVRIRILEKFDNLTIS